MPIKLVFWEDLDKIALSEYIFNLMWKKKLGSFNDWINAFFNPSYVYCLRYKHFLACIFCKVSLAWRHWWTEFSQSWKDLSKTLRNHKTLQSLTDPNGANIGFRSNSRDWLFWMLMMPKSQPINEQKHAVSSASVGLHANRTLLTELNSRTASLTFIFK